MADVITLLAVIQQRFGVVVDPDSDGGQILNSLKPQPPLADGELDGDTVPAALTFVPTESGSISVRAAQGTDSLVFGLPEVTRHFTLVPADAAHPTLQVEITLASFTLPVPFLRPAQVGDDGLLKAAGDKVELHFPNLLLVVTATSDASARLAPSHDAAGALEVTMTPPFALIGPGTTLGLGFERGSLNLEGAAPEIRVPTLDIYVAPPNLRALAMRGGGHDLRLVLGLNGGLSGNFVAALAPDDVNAARPRFLHNLALHLRLNRSAVSLLELSGQIALRTEIETRLGQGLDDPDAPTDLNYTLSLVLDDGWQVALTLSASGGGGYLWRTRNRVPGAPAFPRDTLGAYAVFAPLLSGSLPDPNDGYASLGVNTALAGALAGAGWVQTDSITIYGGELRVQQNADGLASFLFFDLETELNLNLHLGDVELLKTRRPLKVRHQAMGLKLDFEEGSLIKPVFDPSRGFNLDLSDPGMFEMPDPLGSILQPEGARTARDNPVYFEVDLVMKADLGVVSVDRATVRFPLDGGVPMLTALGAHINVPGALSGGGYLKVGANADGKGTLEGSLDVSLPLLGVRAAAGLRLESPSDSSLTGVLATLDVEFPIPLVLGSSGLGIFGFLGLFGMHFQRKQGDSETALDWFKRINGNVTTVSDTAWEAAAHKWALGFGAVIGTLEGGFLVHAKGMILIELPGPRVLVVMKADILSERPPKEGGDTGTLLAVIEIKPDSITIGVMLDYSITPLLEAQLPAEAYFNWNEPEKWYLDVGGIPPTGQPVSVTFLQFLRAEGYLLLHGDGINEFSPPLRGVAVAAGVRAALTWGPEDIGLYLRIAASVDVGISFRPFLIVGKMAVSGELHLFIVSIGVSADATLIIMTDPVAFFIHVEVCGSVDFFFFEVEGCITLEIGTDPSDALPPAPALIRTLSLHSRSPALVEGSANDSPVDGSLGDAAHWDGAQWVNAPHWDGAQWVNDTPLVVPVDAIPVLQLEMRAAVDGGCTFFGTAIPTLLPADPPDDVLDATKINAGAWQRRGERLYHYRLRSVTLDPPPLAGETPNAWWDRFGVANPGDANDVQLALLSWIPDPTPAAAERTRNRDEAIKRRWGTLCHEVASAAAILWTFHNVAFGTSAAGWTLTGTALPDPPDTTRSAPPDLRLHVSEPWRTGNALADGLAVVDPAYVYGAPSVADHLLIAPRTGSELRMRGEDDADFQVMLAGLHLQPLPERALGDALRLNTHGMRRVRVLLFVRREVLDAGMLTMRGLDEGGNPTPFEQTLDAATTTLIAALDDFPAGDWRDPASPWMQQVEDVRNAWYQYYITKWEGYVLIFYEANGLEGVDQVEIGWRGDPVVPGRTWGLLIVEALTEAEYRRVEYDDEQRDVSIHLIDGALHANEGNRALLSPNTQYTVTVTYDAVTSAADADGHPTGDANVEANLSQKFLFQTQDAPPERLDPWVLATSPAPYEQFVFYGDPLYIVFAHSGVQKLYRAYGRELRVVMKASSSRHPQPGGGFDGDGTLLSAVQTAPLAIPTQAATPWESAVRATLGEAVATCVNLDEATERHERITLKVNLEPFTDYTLDLVAADASHPDTPPILPTDPLFRRHFSTSRYATAEALAEAIHEASSDRLRHRRLASAAALTRLAQGALEGQPLQVRDLDFEGALRADRWGDLSRTDVPRVTVIWLDGAPPQPFAVLIEAPEPLWRWRETPAEITDAHGTRRYQLAPMPWLDVTHRAGAALIPRLVYSTDGARTLIVLPPGARGGTLALDLKRTQHLLFEGTSAAIPVGLVDITLTAVPWEEPS